MMHPCNSPKLAGFANIGLVGLDMAGLTLGKTRVCIAIGVGAIAISPVFVPNPPHTEIAVGAATRNNCIALSDFDIWCGQEHERMSTLSMMPTHAEMRKTVQIWHGRLLRHAINRCTATSLQEQMIGTPHIPRSNAG